MTYTGAAPGFSKGAVYGERVKHEPTMRSELDVMIIRFRPNDRQ